ncbi:hypothetical protein [Candidatus Acidulodesulfobacterium sp. H_13]
MSKAKYAAERYMEPYAKKGYCGGLYELGMNLNKFQILLKS